MHLPCPCRLVTPHHPTQDEQRGATSLASTPLILLACYCCSCACLRLPACLLEAHARSSQTHKDCIVSSPRHSCHLPWSAQQSSLILPVFTNRPFSCSSNPGSRPFVSQTLRNSSLRARHCCTASSSSWEILHTKALHYYATRADVLNALRLTSISSPASTRTALRHLKIGNSQRHCDLTAARSTPLRHRTDSPIRRTPLSYRQRTQSKPINHPQPCRARPDSIFLCSPLTSP